MSTPDEIIASLTTAASAFEPVVSAPTDNDVERKLVISAPKDNDVERIYCTIVNILQRFCYHGSQESLSVIIESEAQYVAQFGHTFDCLETSDTD